MEDISLEDIELAYKKYKSYIYYDNSDLFNRKKIADFESKGIEKLLKKLQKALKKCNIEEYLEQIDYYELPKKFEEREDLDIIINYDNQAIKIKNTIKYINAPIEIHIISVLWIMEYIKNNDLPNLEYCYGNILDINNSGTFNGELNLFQPYYIQYTKWREKAIEQAKNLLELNKNVAIISLDIANYYDSVRLNIEEQKYSVGNTIVQDCMNKIYMKYSEDIKEKYKLPIGLLSSSILANIYLQKLDKSINEKLKPSYYGRYVDDILIVFEIPHFEYKNKEEFLKEWFNDILILEKEQVRIVDYEELKIQSEKTKVILLDKDSSTSILDGLRKNLREQSSEYRFLPDEEVLEQSFDDFSIDLIYNRKNVKLRDIKELQDDKFAISTFLTKKIFLSLQGHPSDILSTNQIVNFFKGSKAVIYMSLWEKVFVFFVVNNNKKALKMCLENICQSIEQTMKATLEDQEQYNYRLYHNMFMFLDISLALALTLRIDETIYDLGLYNCKRKYSTTCYNRYLCREYFNCLCNDFFEIYILSKSFRDSRMVRTYYAKSILVEMANKNENDEYLSLMDSIANFDIKSSKFEKYKFYPRIFKHYELMLAYYIHKIETAQIESIGHEDINDICSKLDICITHIDKQDNKLPMIELHKNKNNEQLRIGLANLNIDEKIFEKEYISSPSVEKIRRDEMNKILNQAINENVELLVLPECSIPYEWLHWIVDFSYRKQIGIVFGLEHILKYSRNQETEKGIVYNLLVTLLPYKKDEHKSLFLDMRVKKHYSPEEISKLEEYGYSIPKTTRDHIIYNWNNIRFTTFNCYELTNIQDRAKYKSHIDMLVTCEWNKDTTYFANIIESTSRDLHCYCVQSNNALFGDNLIYQPTSSIFSHIIRLKGGKNSTILVEDIDIKKLREFQLLDYETQKKDGLFKVTPPDFDKNNVKQRMK